MKRSRGRGRRSGGGNNNNPNKHFESNGPDVKIRGSAQQILDKYQQYARDAQSSGDRVNAENYLQHAEHYYRVLATLKPKPKPESQDSDNQNTDNQSEDGNQAKADDEDGQKHDNNRGRGRGRNRRDRDEHKTESEGVEAKAETDGDAEEAVVTSSDASEDAPVVEDKPKRRRTYKKRTPEPDGDDGVMKTLSRGRKKAAPKADADAPAAEASATED